MHDLDHSLLEADAPYESEYESYENDDGSYEHAMYGSSGGVLDEDEENELATDLLNATNDQEIEEFLGKIIRRVGRKVGKAVPGSVGKLLKGGLKNVVKNAVPAVAGLIPGGGTAVAAAKMLGLELEGMSPEDQEFEAAKRVVRLAADAAANASDNASSREPAEGAARRALATAAQRHAPGLLAGQGQRPGPRRNGQAQSGRWVRRGRQIVLEGL